MTRTPIAAGNWKMNGDARLLQLFAAELTAPSSVKAVICPQAPLLSGTSDAVFAIGAQDCHQEAAGAYTGNLSASLLKSVGVSYVILGHSERREYHGESNALVKAKAEQALENGLTAIICVGETLEEREAGQAETVVLSQIAESLPKGATAANTVIAYEPVWAIGTGKVATPDDVKQMHGAIRAKLGGLLKNGADLSVLYGGSVKASNAEELFALDDVDGALVGGASLKVADFQPVIDALAAAKG